MTQPLRTRLLRAVAHLAAIDNASFDSVVARARATLFGAPEPVMPAMPTAVAPRAPIASPAPAAPQRPRLVHSQSSIDHARRVLADAERVMKALGIGDTSKAEAYILEIKAEAKSFGDDLGKLMTALLPHGDGVTVEDAMAEISRLRSNAERYDNLVPAFSKGALLPVDAAKLTKKDGVAIATLIGHPGEDEEVKPTRCCSNCGDRYHIHNRMKSVVRRTSGNREIVASSCAKDECLAALTTMAKSLSEQERAAKRAEEASAIEGARVGAILTARSPQTHCCRCGIAFDKDHPMSGSNGGPSTTQEEYFTACNKPECIAAMMKTFDEIAERERAAIARAS